MNFNDEDINVGNPKDDIYKIADAMPEDIKKLLKDNIDSITEDLASKLNYTPSIVVLGQTGVGKSSFINALFGKKIVDTSNGGGCTRELKTLIHVLDNGKEIFITDVPGIGESEEWDRQYIPMYKELLPRADIILWVLSAPDRKYKEDISFYEKYIYDFCKENKIKIVLVCSQIDRVEDEDGNSMWGNNEPLDSFFEWFKLKIDVLKKNFKDLESVAHIIPVSSKYNYGIKKVILTAIKGLPADRKFLIMNAVDNSASTRKEDNRSKGKEDGKSQDNYHREDEDGKANNKSNSNSYEEKEWRAEKKKSWWETLGDSISEGINKALKDPEAAAKVIVAISGILKIGLAIFKEVNKKNKK